MPVESEVESEVNELVDYTFVHVVVRARSTNDAVMPDRNDYGNRGPRDQLPRGGQRCDVDFSHVAETVKAVPRRESGHGYIQDWKLHEDKILSMWRHRVGLESGIELRSKATEVLESRVIQCDVCDLVGGLVAPVPAESRRGVQGFRRDPFWTHFERFHRVEGTAPVNVVVSRDDDDARAVPIDKLVSQCRQKEAGLSVLRSHC